MGMLSARCGRDDTGSGTAIGVAIMFVPLMGVIVLLSMLTGSARVEQTLQSTANRASPHGVALLPPTSGEAENAVHTALTAAQGAAAGNRVVCSNVLAHDSTITFTNVGRNPVTEPGEAVPPGGSVSVMLRCEIPPEALGGVGIPGLVVERRVTGVASIDPFRSRSGG